MSGIVFVSSALSGVGLDGFERFLAVVVVLEVIGHMTLL
jgi:hypothetical protein